MLSVQFFIEIALVVLIAVGLWHEEEIADWERKQIRKIRRARRNRRKRKGYRAA